MYRILNDLRSDKNVVEVVVCMESVREVLYVLLNFIQTVSIWDILDISIVAYLIYRIITVVRKTSSGSVIKGIIVILAVMWFQAFSISTSSIICLARQ